VAVERMRYSTPEHLALEQRFIDRVASSRNGGACMVGGDAVERAVESRPTLSEEQRGMVKALSLRGDGRAVVGGKAGTGKTFALGAAGEAWHAAGYPVLRVATARRAANEFADGRRDREHERRGAAQRPAAGCCCLVNAYLWSTRPGWF